MRNREETPYKHYYYFNSKGNKYAVVSMEKAKNRITQYEKEINSLKSEMERNEATLTFNFNEKPKETGLYSLSPFKLKSEC